MTWTYDPTLAAPKDRVRSMTGDTDQADQLAQDEEIAAILTSFSGDERLTAYEVLSRAAVAAARLVDRTVGRMSASLSKRAEGLRKAASDFLDREVAGAPVAGGISRSDKMAEERDTDRVKPEFSVDMHDSIKHRKVQPEDDVLV